MTNIQPEPHNKSEQLGAVIVESASQNTSRLGFLTNNKISTHWGGLKTKLGVIMDARRKEAHAIFNPHPKELDPLLSPSSYKELEGFPITERKLVTDKHLGKPSAEVTLWEKKAEAGKPHIFYFLGRSGHVADTGRAISPENGYDRKVGLKFLAEIAKTGAGFTCVTMSGYGNNLGEPSEKAFKCDIKTIVKDWLQQKDHAPADQVIVAGYSLGGANAAIMAKELTKRGLPPALLVIANSFSSMVTRGTEYLADNLAMHADQRVRDVKFTEKEVGRYISRNPFNTDKILAFLSPHTHVCFAYSSDDKLVPKAHSQRMIQTAKQFTPVIEKCFEGFGHTNVPAATLADCVLGAYEHVKSPQGQQEKQAMQQKRSAPPLNFVQQYRYRNTTGTGASREAE